MLCSLIGKRSLCTKYFTSVRSKPYCNSGTVICKEDTLKELKSNDVVRQDKSLKEKLEHIFNTKMRNDAYPLFSDFDTYSKWMPTRDINGCLYLYTLPHYTNDNDLNMLVKKLEEEPESRRDVKYFAAPAKSGKTSTVLPAFLRSAEKEGGFTHYFYIAFSNNNMRKFTATPFKPDDDNQVAYNQGAAFIINCLKNILYDKLPAVDKVSYEIDINDTNIRKAQLYMHELIAKLSKGGKEPRILFHVDEHRKMCLRTDEKNDPGADFSKGVMATLAMVDNNQTETDKKTKQTVFPAVTVIATYTDKPELSVIRSQGSSEVCRAPVGLPPIDIERVMKVTKLIDEKGNYYYPFHFPFDKENLNTVEKRLFATFKFKLAMKIANLGLTNVHFPGSKFKELCEGFNSIIIGTKQNIQEKLIACSKLCNFELGGTKRSKYATELLLGIPEETYETLTKERLADINLLVCNNIWTTTLESLLILEETNNELVSVYELENTKTMMINLTSGETYDYLSNTPLELAYRWTLSCRSARSSKIMFGDWVFWIKCEAVEAGRIFNDGTTTMTNTIDEIIKEKLQKNTLYYAEEGDGKPTHPLFDLFFLCKHKGKDTLVMIDITGGGILTAENKLAKLSKWIGEQRHEEYDLKGIVLAPGAKMKNKFDTNAAIIGQKDALKLLGGLQQIYRWFLDDEDEVDVLNKE